MADAGISDGLPKFSTVKAGGVSDGLFSVCCRKFSLIKRL
jgi:hypothetical protein